MRFRFIYLLKYAIFWMLFFIVCRLFFVIYNVSHFTHFSISELLLIFVHGAKLDISIVGYLLFFNAIILAFFISQRSTISIWYSKIFTGLFVFLFSFITIIDAELYRNWGFRMDSTVFLYLRTPKESLASTPVILIFALFFMAVLLGFASFLLYRRWVEKTLQKAERYRWYMSPVYLLFAGVMIIPIRGGVGIAPINQGTVYFSQNVFSNHAALNEIWNLGELLSTMNQRQDVQFMSSDEANKHFAKLFTPRKDTVSIINNKRPNILILIMESFTANVVGSLGGKPGVTPNLDRLSKNGVFFTNFYASGDRSDKGIVSVLSGYPAQPTTSIIKYINKSAKLPHLSKELKKLGYSSGFYYGGEINFANMNSYFISGGYENLVTLNDFSSNELNSKWGAHDHVVFNRLLQDLNKCKNPFFRVMFSLSSHEPFDVPHHSQFDGNSEEEKFLNSVNYTDSCLGNFIDRAGNTSWWNNTWIIIVADHGSRWPGNISYNIPDKFRIPMLWTGGAVKTDSVISETASQDDIPLMIANQMGISIKGLDFCKDVINRQPGFAFYAFNNGFGFVSDTAVMVWDNTSNKVILKKNMDESFKKTGLSFMQKLWDNFNSK